VNLPDFRAARHSRFKADPEAVNRLRAADLSYGSFHCWLAVPAQPQICSWVPEPP
jgi:hypothetical protein